MPLAVYLPAIYAQHFGLPLATIGLIFLLERLWGAAADPLIGVLSDRTDSSIGRRRVWIIAGAALYTAGSVPLFFPPDGFDAKLLAVALFVFYLGWSMIQIPYLAWSGEISGGYDERTRIATFATVAGAASLLLVLILPTIIDQVSPGDARLKLAAFGLVVIGGLAITVPLTLAAASDRSRPSGGHVSFGQAVRLVIADRLLIALTIAQGLAQGSGNLMLRSIVADVADKHRLETGTDRTALFFSVFSLSSKAGMAAAITDKAIGYIDRQRKLAKDKPFFLYYAPAAAHAPHQVATQWSDRYKGRFDAGWDVYRQQVFAQQKRLGVIPANTVLPDRDPTIAPWASLPGDEKRLYARFMEVYTGFLSFTDHEIGRLVDHLERMGQLDNTVFMVVIGDNGGSKEGTLNGDVDRELRAPPLSEKDNIAYNLARIDKIGSPEGIEANYPLGWAQATNTPFRCWKQDADCEGGTRNPLILSYPKGIAARGVRTQYGHVIDVLPTTLDLLKITPPSDIHGVRQQPVEGISLAYSIDAPTAPSRHRTQHYYIFGSRAIYHDGWKASLSYPNRLFGGGLRTKPFDESAWRLYDLNTDFTERVDLAKTHPEKLAELKALFETEAQRHNLYPLITWDDVLNRRIHREDTWGGVDSSGGLSIGKAEEQ